MSKVFINNPDPEKPATEKLFKILNKKAISCDKAQQKNPYAFPSAADSESLEINNIHGSVEFGPYPGMTLRDYIAISALT